MAFPLPHTIVADDVTFAPDADEIQANFDALAKLFPLTRKSMAVEDVNVVGAAGQPAFENSWVNYPPTHQAAGFWKDPFGLVHVRGMVQSGTIGSTIFTLPVGYRPLAIQLLSSHSSSGQVRCDVNPNGTVVNFTTNGWYSLAGITFQAEQ